MLKIFYYFPQQFLYFLPLPHQQSSFLLNFSSVSISKEFLLDTFLRIKLFSKILFSITFISWFSPYPFSCKFLSCQGCILNSMCNRSTLGFLLQVSDHTKLLHNVKSTYHSLMLFNLIAIRTLQLIQSSEINYNFYLTLSFVIWQEKNRTLSLSPPIYKSKRLP